MSYPLVSVSQLTKHPYIVFPYSFCLSILALYPFESYFINFINLPYFIF